MDYIFSNKISELKPSAIREILKYSSDPSVISLAAGNPAAEAFPIDEIAKITADIMCKNPILALQYSVSEGYLPLRDRICGMLKQRYGIGTDSDNLIILSGAQQVVELAAKIFCNEGDTVICESPSFVGSLNAFRSHNVNLAGVKMEDDGISIEGLERAIADNKNVKLLYLIPNFQNPTGITMSAGKRLRCYELAKKHGFVIIEDNPYGDLRFSGDDIASIKSLDSTGHVIYAGSFSKVISPGLRVGYALADSRIISKMTVAKQVSDVHTAMLSQLICERFLRDYSFDEHIGKLRGIYKNKCSLMLGQIAEHFPKNVKTTHPEGGLFIWVTLPENLDAVKFCETAVREYKVAIVPGIAFLTDESGKSSSFRLNFSTPSDEKIVSGIQILGKLLHEVVK